MNFTSYQGQDRFVYELIVKPENLLTGSFLDIGCGGLDGSNTLGLEEIGWRGILFDKVPILNESRKSTFIIGDATTHNWNDFSNPVTDYLSFDVDSSSRVAIRNVPFDKTKFRVLTVEHDAYCASSPVRSEMRNLIQSYGYKLICADICCDPGKPFEDWWVCPELESRAEKFKCDGKYWEDIFK